MRETIDKGDMVWSWLVAGDHVPPIPIREETMRVAPTIEWTHLNDLMILSLLLTATACAPATDIDTESTPGDLGETEQPLLAADAYTAACADYIDDIEPHQARARQASRSVGFQLCVATAMKFGIAFDYVGENGGSRGPYVACGNEECLCGTPGCAAGPCDYDPLLNEGLERQTARLLSATVSEYVTRHDCQDVLFTTGTPGANNGNFDWPSDQERFVWHTIDATNSPWMSAVPWHEVMHTHEYDHESDDFTCGYDSDGYHAAPQIVGSCMREVIDASLDLCYGGNWSASTPCSANELYVVKGVGPYATSACECVPGPLALTDREAGDQFGRVLAVGNFNGDDYDDLAVAAVGENNDAGVVHLLRGSAIGLAYWKRLFSNSIEVYDYDTNSEFVMAVESDDGMGSALASGDFNDDGFDDLVIGIPFESLNDESLCTGAGECGYVAIVPGSAAGLDIENAQGLRQTSLNPNETGDHFGYAVAVGDFDVDGVDDLLVGAPGENSSSGGVYAFKGRDGASPTRKLVAGWDAIWQTDGGWASESSDQFGAAIAVGNFQTNDSAPEAVVGAPGENTNEGCIFVVEIVGSAWDVTDAKLNPEAAQVGGLGSSLAVGDFRGTTVVDVAAGAPAEDTGRGAVYIFEGSSTDLDFGQRLGQTASGNENNDEFGKSLAAGQVLTGKSTLLVGVPHERWGSGSIDEGIVEVWLGGTANATYQGYLRQNKFFDCTDAAAGYCVAGDVGSPFTSTDTLLPPEGLDEDVFGMAIAIGNFTSLENNIVVGAPFDAAGIASPVQGAGAIFVFNKNLGDIVKVDQVTQRFGDDYIIDWLMF
jgi:hypothetical protein